MSTLDHYFSDDPSVPSEPREVNLTLPDGQWRFTTDRGVFSYREVDAATRLLLTAAPAPEITGPVLDLGCGYGVISAVWATRAPDRDIWAVDVNSRALHLTKINTKEFGSQVKVCQPDEVPAALMFATIYSNPPIRVGKASLHQLLRHWLGRLLPQGVAYLVVNKNLGADSLSRWLSEENYDVRRPVSRRGNRILEVRHSS